MLLYDTNSLGLSTHRGDCRLARARVMRERQISTAPNVHECAGGGRAAPNGASEAMSGVW